MKQTCLVMIAGVCTGFFFSYVYLPESSPYLPMKPTKLVPNAKRDSESISNFSGIRILCWVATYPSNHQKKAIHILQTWGSRCDQLIFMSSWNDWSLPGVVALPVKEGREYLWQKTKAALYYLRENYLNDYDWFFKADDDTYAIMENMHHMLQPLDPSMPYYLGCRFKPFQDQGYMSGGAGYILSRAALELLVDGLRNEDLCPSDDAMYEDVALGKCAANTKLISLDTRDENGALRFHPYSPEYHLDNAAMNQSFRQWLSEFSWTAIRMGLDCCSPHAVSFHYLQPSEMYLFDYLIYRLKPYGIKHSVKKPRKRKHKFHARSHKELKLWKRVLR